MPEWKLAQDWGWIAESGELTETGARHARPRGQAGDSPREKKRQEPLGRPPQTQGTPVDVNRATADMDSCSEPSFPECQTTRTRTRNVLLLALIGMIAWSLLAFIGFIALSAIFISVP
jgi:hypothetical protein